MEEWVILFKGRVIARFSISEGQCLVIGRGQEADVVINNPAVSRRQSSLELKNGQYYLADLLSMNGTKVNRKKIRSPTPISKSDQLSISKFDLKPAQQLLEAAALKPAASMAKDYEDGDLTRYVSGIYNETDLRKKKVTPKDRELTVLEGHASPAKLILKGKGITAGKDSACDLLLSGFFLGKIQFTIACRKEGYVIAHVAGLRKTWVNGKRLLRNRLLQSMDVIQVGGIKIRFK
ncbi:MAG: FHA domain-containing protein [Desulfobulbaceae bacterium]|nr:FHA domain-containing protein [Desulfobulbaceae bacterium]